MRKIFILLLLIIFLIPVSASPQNTDMKNCSMEITTELVAGSLSGFYSGFSSTSLNNGVKPISGTTQTLTLHSTNNSVSEIYADGSYYVYWVLNSVDVEEKAKDTLTSLTLAWQQKESDVTQNIFSVYVGTDIDEDNKKESGWGVTSSTQTSGDQQFSVRTGDLRNTPWNATLTLNMTLTAVFN